MAEAPERVRDQGFSHVILDGKIIPPTDPCKETTISVKGEVIDLWYSGKVWARCTGRWRTLQLTASRSKIGDIAPAALVLTHFEYGYIT